MHFLNETTPPYDLTYSDVFMVPSFSTAESRFDVDLTPPEKSLYPENSGPTLPIVVANMTAVAGRRMAETVARRGGVTILPQDLPLDVVEKNISRVRAAHHVYKSPLTLAPDDRVKDASELIHKLSHQTVHIIDDNNMPVGVVTRDMWEGKDRYARLSEVMSSRVDTFTEHDPLEDMWDFFEGDRNKHILAVLGFQGLVGVMTQKDVLRARLYKPALNQNQQMMVGAAVGINGNPADTARRLVDIGASIIVVDTAHGHQIKALRAVEAVEAAINGSGVPIAAGNVVTQKGTRDLIEAGADIVKVGVGPGAMCTTRMQTGVGRPQFSAVLECATEARDYGRFVWADGGIKHPRDVALALAAGASSVMIGSGLVGTWESPGDPIPDDGDRFYKLGHGMASGRAVKERTMGRTGLQAGLSRLFEEGISASKLYIDPERGGVEDIIDDITAGVRSSCTYAGALSIKEFHTNAVVGIQSSAGYEEGRPHTESW